MSKSDKKMLLGWREWLSLPELGIPAIKAKIDTGARTSALHTFELAPFEIEGQLHVRFGIHPLQKKAAPAIHAVAPVIDQRLVRDSGGHVEERYVIETSVTAGEDTWPLEITLTNREDMTFRMLLGRTALRKRILVDPGRSFLLGRSLRASYPESNRS